MAAQRKIITTLALGCLLVNNHAAKAADSLVAILNGPTLHISPNHYNRATWGGGIGYQVSASCILGIGTYQNSIARRSNYLALDCDMVRSSGLLYGGAIGVVTGYQDSFIKAAYPEVGYKLGDDAVKFIVLPPISVVHAWTINVRLEVKF